MALNISFPQKRAEKVVATPMMRSIAERTLAVHPLGALVSWTGEAGIGKTSTAKLMVEELESQYDASNPDAFRAVHYEVGEISSWSGHENKKAIRSLYHATLGPLNEGTYRYSPPEAIASQLIRGLRRKNIRMIFVDEAGLLSLRAIRGMVTVRDVAENEGWTLTIVLIGMDNLCRLLTKNPQVERRIHEWCYFRNYNVEDTWKLLQHLSPWFADLDARKPEHHAMVEYVHKHYEGNPGKMVPFLQRLDRRMARGDVRLDMMLLKGVRMYTLQDRNLSLGKAADTGLRGEKGSAA
jgi:hypothetical protein